MIFSHTVGSENVALTPKYVASQGKPFKSCPGALRILNTILGFWPTNIKLLTIKGTGRCSLLRKMGYDA